MPIGSVFLSQTLHDFQEVSSSPFKMDFKGRGGGTSKRKCDASHAPIKQRSSEFYRSSSMGVVTKLDSRGIRSLVEDSDAQVVIRPLGERVETFSLQQTIYVESAVEEDVIGGLKSKVSHLEDLVARLEKRVAQLEKWFVKRFESDTRQLQKRLEVTEKQLEVIELFSHQGMSNALRAFCDLVLAAFFKACRKEAAGFQERAAWLANSGADGAYAFLTQAEVTQAEVTLQLLGVEMIVGRKDIQLIRSLRKASSDVSSVVSHSVTPIEVAIALEKEGANIFGGDLKNISALFQSLFDVSWKKMVKDWKDGNRNKEFQKKFKPPRLLQI